MENISIRYLEAWSYQKDCHDAIIQMFGCVVPRYEGGTRFFYRTGPNALTTKTSAIKKQPLRIRSAKSCRPSSGSSSHWARTKLYT